MSETTSRRAASRRAASRRAASQRAASQRAASQKVARRPQAGPNDREVVSAAADAQFGVHPTSIHRVEADGVRVFYRAAGDTSAPAVLLLHGFPASSFMFRELIPRLANDYRVIAPDLPGFGFTEVPIDRRYSKKRVFRPIGLPPTS